MVAFKSVLVLAAAIVSTSVQVVAHPLKAPHQHRAVAPPTKRAHRRAQKCRAPPSVASASATAVLAGATLPASSPKPTQVKDDKDEPEPTKTPSSSGSGKISALFPVPYDEDLSWSTNPGAQNVVPLSDSTFHPTAKLNGLANSYVNFEGKKALKALYPKGSYNPSHYPRGGVSFYAPGPDNVDLTQAKEATFGYSVWFPEGFEFNLGGKLFGFYGGDNDKTSLSCSGGRRSDECFSTRLMWRERGQGEFYTYLPPYTDSRYAANKKQCSQPNSDCNPTYGASIGRGAFTFARGAWTTVTQRVRLNDVGKANGEIELFVNGKSKITVKGLILRARSAGRIRGLQLQSFFGGSSAVWASPRDQNVYFADFSVAITEKL